MQEMSLPTRPLASNEYTIGTKRKRKSRPLASWIVPEEILLIPGP